MAKHDHAALLRRQRADRTHELVVEALGGVDRWGVHDAGLGSKRPRSRPVDRPVDDDAMQPRGERPAAVETVEVPNSGEKRLLGDVLGRRGVVDDEIGGALGLPPVTAEQLRERVLGAATGVANESAVVARSGRHLTTVRRTRPERSMPEIRRERGVRSMDLCRATHRRPGMRRKELVLAALATPLALGSLPRGARGANLGGTPVALVTADEEAHVAAVSLLTGEVFARIRTESGPRSIESRLAAQAVVAHTDRGLVTVIDGVALDVSHVIDGFEQPRYTATRGPIDTFAGSDAIAYVTDSGSETVVTLDLARGRIVRRTPVPGPARHVGISPDGSMLWTVLGTKAERIAVLDVRDARRPRLVRTFAAPFLSHDIVFSPWGSVWVTSGAERRIAVYRPGRGKPRLYDADAAPQHVAFTGVRAFVASGDDGLVRVHRRDGTLVRRTRVPLGSYNVTFGWQRLVTPSLGGGTVALLDANGRVKHVRRIARATHDACYVLG